jgi:hypothetical protein
VTVDWAGWVKPVQVISGIASAIGLIVSSIGLLLNARGQRLTTLQISRSRKTTDLQVLQKFFELADERDTALTDALRNGDDFQFPFNQLLNFLEIHCGAYNDGLFGPATREMVRHKLEDCYIEITVSDATRAFYEAAKDRHTTFEQIEAFAKRHKREIRRRRNCRPASPILQVYDGEEPPAPESTAADRSWSLR